MTRQIFPLFSVPNCVPLPEEARLRSTYAACRYRNAARPVQKVKAGAYVWQSVTPAAEALAEARAIVAAGGYKFGPRFAAGFGCNRQSDKGGLYIENPAAAGLRYVGTAEELAGPYSRTPSGYYLDPEGGGETVCGVVYQLPGRKGRAQFVAGYADPYNGNPGQGPACLWFGQIFESDPYSGADLGRGDGAKAEAAQAADSHAEAMAEEEREYQTAWRAGSRWADLKAEEEEARAEALAILAERRKARGLDPSGFPALCAALRGQVAALCRQIAKSRKARAKLAEGDAEELYFWNGEERLRAAFCEAAGLESFPA